jgi:hypothetical protein
MFLHNLLNVLVQIANKMGLQKTLLLLLLLVVVVVVVVVLLLLR